MSEMMQVPQPIKADEPDYAELANQLAAFVKEFTKESDRAAVILVAAKVDYLLSQVLEKFLLPNSAGQDELLDTERALGTFSARIHVVFRLGLIDAEFARALHLFRRLRNSFAHEISGSTLEHGSHRDRVREIVGPCTVYNEWKDIRNYFKDHPGIRGDFFTSSAIIVGRLDNLRQQMRRVVATVSMTLVPGKWTKNT